MMFVVVIFRSSHSDTSCSSLVTVNAVVAAYALSYRLNAHIERKSDQRKQLSGHRSKPLKTLHVYSLAQNMGI